MSSCGQRAAGADLRGLLAEQRGPDAQLALPLQRGRLDVPPADEREVAVEPAQLVVADVERVVGVLDALALGREQLDQVRLLRAGAGPPAPGTGSTTSVAWSQRGHGALLAVSRGAGVAGRPRWWTSRGAGVWHHSHMVTRHTRCMDNTTPEPICARSLELIAQKTQ